MSRMCVRREIGGRWTGGKSGCVYLSVSGKKKEGAEINEEQAQVRVFM